MEIAIRVSENPSDAEKWTLVLTAVGIPHRLEHAAAGWRLLVPDAEVHRAHAALEADEAEAREAPDAVPPQPRSHVDSWVIGVAVGVLLLAFFAVTGPSAAGSRWSAAGAASARQILNGQLYRTVTALTLHVDAVHVFSNAVATSVLLAAVVQRLGPGRGVWLTLVAGAAANLLSAIVHDASHVAVGASTATFGAIGILTGLRLVPGSSTTRPRWAVLAAAVLLLAMLGTGGGSDVLGHALGLLCGGGLGVLAGLAFPRRFGALTDWSLVGAAVAVVVGCWVRALG
jgi:rhomboid protease GluP